MATQRRSQRSEPKRSTIKEAATSFGDMVETAAGVLGRGMAATVRGAGEIADRASEMTGLSTKEDAPPTAAVRAASQATERVSRTAAKGAGQTRRAATSAVKKTARAAANATGAATRARKKTRRSSTPRPRSTGRSARSAPKRRR